MAKVIILDPDDPGLHGRILRFLMKHVVWIALLVLVVLGVINNIYTIPADSRGIILRFGVISGIAEPGLHVKMPIADEIFVVPTERTQSLEFGFRFVRTRDNRISTTEVPDEKMMLTRDNKLIEIEWVMHFHINRPEDYVFNLPVIPAERDKILRDICMSAMRRIFAASLFDEGLTDGKERIQDDAFSTLQSIFDELQIGIRINEVLLQETNVNESIREAYYSVTTAEEQVRNMLYQAETHANRVVPEAEGRAAVLINEAEAYKFRRIAEAEGEAARLSLLQEAYLLNPELTRLNMWADSMSDVWRRLRVVFVEGLSEAGGTLRVLPLPLETIFQDLRGGEAR